MNSAEYRISFTAGGLFHNESVQLAELYQKLNDWDLVKEKTIAENLLQTRTQNTLKRFVSEIFPRLQIMTPAEITFLVNANHQEQAHLLWVLACRRYRLIAEFAVEVLRERYITLKKHLSYEDFDTFFNQKSEWHPKLEKTTAATRYKIRQVLFKMLRDVGFLAKDDTMQPVLLNPELLKVLWQNNQKELLYFPMFEADIRGLKP